MLLSEPRRKRFVYIFNNIFLTTHTHTHACIKDLLKVVSSGTESQRQEGNILFKTPFGILCMHELKRKKLFMKQVQLEVHTQDQPKIFCQRQCRGLTQVNFKMYHKAIEIKTVISDLEQTNSSMKQMRPTYIVLVWIL